MSERKPSRIEQILDLLIEEIQERVQIESRSADHMETEVRTESDESSPAKLAAEVVERSESAEGRLAAPEPPREATDAEPPLHIDGPSHAARLLARLVLWVFVGVVLINIPFNRYGTTLAKAMPDEASYVIRDGLVVKEEDDEEIYVYQDGAFRWITSLDAFEHYGYTWEDVHIVTDGYLDRFTIGVPIHVLLKCETSPHIYRLEGGRKRWIRDIDTFVAEGHVWEDVRFVSCEYLRGLADGETIPPGSGPPPQP